MTQYTKENETYTLGEVLKVGEKSIIPTEEWLVENGWSELAIPELTTEAEPTSAQLRKQAYATNPLVAWENELLSVDEANQLFVAYLAEGDTYIATELSALISAAKVQIRGEYGDD